MTPIAAAVLEVLASSSALIRADSLGRVLFVTGFDSHGEMLAADHLHPVIHPQPRPDRECGQRTDSVDQHVGFPRKSAPTFHERLVRLRGRVVLPFVYHGVFILLSVLVRGQFLPFAFGPVPLQESGLIQRR